MFCPHWQVYQITTHKIHVYNESDERVGPRAIPSLPVNNKKRDERKGDDILANFDSANKKPKMDIDS